MSINSSCNKMRSIDKCVHKIKWRAIGKKTFKFFKVGNYNNKSDTTPLKEKKLMC